ncbi:carboxypeptidase-like regulatory domain-containing protein [Sphingobacteriaceae bacterium WQ 2009]|uniref:Carboxypeptidase-like regulatory domain-containing protein n=1 Tax=Rhinopithecimicrobium faecis TaxID=2820698 RepID=A0A8T4HCE9_9SPHI|nr:carboxypeptidase-like regulatory domain-containing protein [Sphingobacteriaceae bacterium WQ 2009]
MKYLLLLISSLFFYGADLNAASYLSDTTALLHVAGNCDMCKQRIEKASLSLPAVKKAVWQSETQQLQITFQPEKTTLSDIRQAIAAVGHDVDSIKAPTEVYDKLHSCCLYPRLGEENTLHAKMPTVASNQLLGVVVRADSHGNLTPLVGATIAYEGFPTATLQTDAEGIFKLTLANESPILVVSYTGMQPLRITVKNIKNTLVIQAKDNVLEEVIVQGNRQTAYLSKISPLRIEVITAKDLLKAACCDLSESFETNATVDVASSDAISGAKQIQLLGLGGSYTQLTVENLPGPRGLAIPLGLNSIAGPWIESIQVSKGVGSVANGYESMAGQINVELKKPQNSEQLYFNSYANSMGRKDFNLNLAHKISNNWSVGVLLHDNISTKKDMDVTKNGFRDLPTGNLFSGINRWAYQNDKGFMAQFGVKYLKDDRTGGAISFDPSEDKGSTTTYGLGFDIQRMEAFAKLGYIFPTRKQRSIGLQLSTSDYDQKSYFGITSYKADQQNYYANLLFQDIIGSSAHKYRIGASLTSDRYTEQVDAQLYERRETVSGIFGEYTFSPSEKFDAVLGMRGDYNSLYGWFATPRIQLHYAPTMGTDLRVSAGRGQRTANIFAENTALFASSRTWRIQHNNDLTKAYGLSPEVSWNMGFSIDQQVNLLGRPLGISLELFHTNFQNQVVVDYENPREVSFYNLAGSSYSNSFQAEMKYTPLKGLDLRMAYKWMDVQTDYNTGRASKPLIAKNRGLLNLSYATNNGWNMDYTLHIVGQKRLPSTAENPAQYQLGTHSKTYQTMNAQVSKTVGKRKNFTLYIGGENLTNYFQKTPIIAADQPFGDYFDSSLVWGPLTGRMFYTGIRFHIL